MYASGLVVLGSLTVVAVITGTGWSWPVFATGLVGGIALVAVNHLMLHAFLRSAVDRWHPSADRQRAAREQVRKRQRFYPVLFVMVVGIGVLSAALETYWLIAAALIVCLLAVVVLPLALWPVLVRRVDPRFWQGTEPT